MQCKVPIFFDFFICHPSPTWFRWRESGRRAESDSGGDGLLANPQIVARRRFQTSGRRHRNRSGGFCCFSPSKSIEKSFTELYAESLQGFRKIAVFTNFFLLVLLGPKVPKASARRFPRECASRGAARGAQDQAYAPPRGGRAAARPLFFRVKRECGFIVPPTAAFFILFGNAPRHSFPARRVPTWFRWRESGRRAESESGGDGLLANPRSRPTPLSGVRTPPSESVGWLLLLFAIEKQGKKFFQTFFPEAEKGRREAFCCFSPPKSREKRKSFSGVFLQRTKGHRAASRHLYKKKQSTKNTTLQQGSYTFDLPRKQPPSSP